MAKHTLRVVLELEEYEGEGVPPTIVTEPSGQTLGLDDDGDVYLMNIYGDAFCNAMRDGNYRYLSVGHSADCTAEY